MTTSLDRRNQLAVAAYQLVAESGIERLTLRAVARRVGATTGVVSHHYLDRRDLVDAALDHAVSVMLERASALPAGSSPYDHLAAVLPTDAATLECWRFSLSVRAAGLFDPDLRPFDERIRSYWFDHLPDLLRSVPDADRVEATRHLVALVDGIALGAVLDPAGWPRARQLAHLRAGVDAVEAGAFHRSMAELTELVAP